MIWLAAAFVVVAFLVLLHLLGVPRRAGIVVSRSREAMQVLRDKSSSDEQKEAAMQASAKVLFVQFFLITGAAIVALGVPVAVVAGLQALQLVDLEEVLDRTLSWPILVGATVVGVLGWQLLRRRG